MISFIKGNITEIYEDRVVIECNNIGYEIFVPSSAISGFSCDEEYKIYTCMNVKEDGITLYGFRNIEERNIFKMLIKVSGIGPKGAMSILSTLTVNEIKLAIISDDYKTIAKAPSIGAKTAAKVTLELKDKFNLDEIGIGGEELSDMSDISNDVLNDSIMALAALGYSKSKSANAVRKAYKDNKDADANTLIKLALKKMI